MTPFFRLLALTCWAAVTCLSCSSSSGDDAPAENGAGGTGGGGVPSTGPGGSESLVPPPSALVISEIMYHPVEETTAEDEHEFVELHNAGVEPIDVSGYRLHVGKMDRLTLPEGTSIPADGYLVLAKRREKLLALPSYALAPELVFGDFTGGLDNGGGSVSLLAPDGTVIDRVDYEDSEPWPVGADAFGAQEEWLPALGPYTTHQYLGRSLERYSAELPSSDPRNWEASPVDGATPGRANSVSGEPPAIVLGAEIQSASGSPTTILADESVTITVTLSAGAVSEPMLELRLDPVERIGQSTTLVPLVPDDSGTVYTATVPGTAENTVVRYRILDGARVVGPRPTDPRESYAYFVGPQPASGQSYHLFITPERWTTLWNNIADGRSSRCTTNPTWDDTVPAVFVHEGRVFDVQVRYQGSNYRRTDGLELLGFDAPGPSLPSPLKVLSWRIKFPRYQRLSGLSAINLNKQKQACPGVLNALEGALFAAVQIPAQTFSFARLYINGGYYNYVMDTRNIEEDALLAFEGSDESFGDLFKADGVVDGDTSRNAGPWGLGNFTPLGSVCSLEPAARYALTYERQNHDYKSLTPEGQAELIGLIEELDTIGATAEQDARVRAYFEANFDVDRLLTQFAIRNWAGVWDDGVHNYLPYKRASDGKWVVLPHDFDCDFGGNPVDCGDGGIYYNEPTVSFFHPETGDGVTAGEPSVLKIQFIRAFRSEFAAKITELQSTLFSEAEIDAQLATILGNFDRAAWDEAPVHACDLDGRLAEAKAWLAERRAFFAGGVR